MAHHDLVVIGASAGGVEALKELVAHLPAELPAALWELKDGALARFRCRVGHSFGGDSLVAAMSENLEVAFWAGYRALEETAALTKRLAERAEARGMASLAERYRARYEDAMERASTIRSVLERGHLAAERPPHVA